MNVILKKLIVKENGVVIADITFDDFCTIWNYEKNDVVIDTIKLLVGSTKTKRRNSSAEFYAEVVIDKVYHITGKLLKYATKWSVSVDEKGLQGDFTDEYFSLVEKSKEESAVTYFEDFRKQKYPLRLTFYKDNKYFYKGRFSYLTNGIGATRSFRAFTNEFIKNFKPELINEEKDLWLSLKEDGEFVVRKGKNGKEFSDLSKEELLRYNLLCFLNLVKFWDEFNEIRDINTIKAPVFIKLPDDCNFDLDCLIDRIKKMKRAVIVVR